MTNKRLSGRDRLMSVTVCAVVAGLYGLLLPACDRVPSANWKETNVQAGIQAKLAESQPVPAVEHSQMRQNAIEVLKAQVDSTPTTTFFYLPGVTRPQYVCPSVGFPIAAGASLTNPTQLTSGYDRNGNFMQGAVGQMDPNGIYPGQASGSYVLCVNADGKPYVRFWGGIVSTTAGSLRYDEMTNQEVPTKR